jgi:O-antigen ligase
MARVRLPAPPRGHLPRAPAREELRRFAVGIAFVLAAIAVIELVSRQASASASPVAAGTVVLGLGLLVAVAFGIATNSSLGVLVFLTASLVSVPYGPGAERAAFLALAGGWFISVVTHTRPLRRFGVTEGLMVAYLLLNVASTFTSHLLPASTTLTPTDLILGGAFLPFSVFVIARQTMGNRQAIKAFLWFLVWLGVYLTLMAIFQKLGPKALIFPTEIGDPAVGINPERARGPLLNSAADGVALVIAFIAAMYLGVQRDVRFRRFALAAALVMPLGIFYSQTRAVWLAAGVALVLGTMFARGFRRWYLAVLLGALLVIGINWQKFLSADRQQGGVTSEGEIESRLNDIATALWAIGQEPGYGWGISRFPDVNTEFHKQWDNLDWSLGYGFIGHNTPLSIGAELGLVGLGVWTAVLLSVIVVTARSWRYLPRSGLLSRGLVFSFWCAGLAWLINAVVIDMRLFPFLNAVVLVWAGALASLGDRGAEGTLGPELEAPSAGGWPEDQPEVGDQAPHRPALGHLD